MNALSPVRSFRPGTATAVLRLLAAFVICLLATARAAPIVRLQGTVPPIVKQSYLDQEYRRIFRQLAPRKRLDTTPLFAIFYAAFRDTALSNRIPEWGGGGAVGPDTIIVPVDKQPVLGPDVVRVAVHEIVHCILARAYPRFAVPRWFHEGCAMAFSGEVSMSEGWALSTAVFGGKLLALDTIDAVNALSQTDAQRAYGQSHVAVLFLIEKYGIDVVPRILEAATEQRDFEQGLFRVIGLSTKELQVLVDAQIRTRYGLAFLFGDLFWVWFFIALLFIATYVVVRMRNARKLRAMAEEERRGDAEARVRGEEEQEEPRAARIGNGDKRETDGQTGTETPQSEPPDPHCEGCEYYDDCECRDCPDRDTCDEDCGECEDDFVDEAEKKYGLELDDPEDEEDEEDGDGSDGRGRPRREGQ